MGVRAVVGSMWTALGLAVLGVLASVVAMGAGGPYRGSDSPDVLWLVAWGLGVVSLSIVVAAIAASAVARPFLVRSVVGLNVVMALVFALYCVQLSTAPQDGRPRRDRRRANPATRCRWAHRAQAEWDASVAFEVLAGELVGVDAPAALVERVRQAVDDEIRHAELCLARSGEGGLLHRPARPRRHPRSRTVWLARLAVESVLDGCVNEGAAAARLEAEAATAAPELAAVLAAIAADERRHERLAWDIVDWCVAAGGRPVERAVGVARRRLP